MIHPTPLTRALGLLLLSLSLGLAHTASAKEKKQAPALQCEQNGVLGPCPDSRPVSAKTGKPVSFKAQSDEPVADKPVKKKKGKKGGSKKAKRSKTTEE